MAVSSAPRTSWCRAYTLRGEGVMRRRGYLDLTPTEFLARRYVVWGGGLFAMPSLPTSCHTLNDLCQARWDRGALSLVTLWALFPWMLPIALVMFGGLGMCMLGGVLFLSAGQSGGALYTVQTAAFRMCVGSLLAILLLG